VLSARNLKVRFRGTSKNVSTEATCLVIISGVFIAESMAKWDSFQVFFRFPERAGITLVLKPFCGGDVVC